MRVTGDLGFSSLVLVVVCFVVPVIGFVVRRKWQHAVARNEEVKKLLILAAEEVARAESEASYVYGTVSVLPKNNQCAVCYCPTTTRCARCKAVRYCSGKCQIIHWRQGHKEECHPSSIIHQTDELVNDLGKKVAEQDYCRIHDEKSQIESTECKPSSEKPPLPDISCSPEISCGKDENIRVESLAEGNITDSNSELSSNSFSGFSASTGASESSDDASICESISSNEHERSEGHIFVDPTVDISDTISSDKSMGVAISSSPKFASLVDSANAFPTMHKLNQVRPGFNKEESNLGSNGASGFSIQKVATIQPSTVSSGFWDKTLDSRGITVDANNDPLPSHYNETTGRKKSDSGSPFCILSSTMPPAGVKDFVSDDVFSNPVGYKMPGVVSASSKNEGVDSSKDRNFLPTGSKVSYVMNYSTNCGSDQLESGEDNTEPLVSSFFHRSSNVGEDSGCADASSIHCWQSDGSKALNHVMNNAGSTLKSTQVGCLPNAFAETKLASRTERHSHSSTYCGNDCIQSGMATSSQVASCSPNSKSGLKTSVLKVVDQFRGSNLAKRFPLAVGSDITGKYSDEVLFPYDLFVKLYNWNKVELQPFGLINCGNSCYANAVLQCLAFTPPLSAYLLQGLHSKSCANKSWCFICEFESLILKSKDTKSALSPLGILSQLQSIGSQLGNGREEDAHEFLRHVVDTMQSVCLMEAGVNASDPLKEETNLMGLTFGGYLRSKIKCMKCGGKSECRERMMDLTVEIEGEIATLEEALQRFTSTETLDGENKYHCIRCKSYEKAKKKLTVSEAPNVLTIALKRFQSGKFGKLNKLIRFPEILDLAPCMSGTSDKSPIYRLYGVVVHLDIMNAAFSGHYVCYVKNIQNKWFKVDDSVVTAVELERVLTKGAYMLFYARCSPRAPRLIRNRIASLDANRKVNGKTITMKSRHASANPGAAEHMTSSISEDGSSPLESPYSKFHHLKMISEGDSSDNSSLVSGNSDEGSCSTDSTHESTSTDDFSDYIFGDSGRVRGSMWRNSDSDTSSSSSSSPLNPGHSPLADMDRYDSGSPDATGLRNLTGPSVERDGPLYRSRPVDVEKRCSGVSHWHSDSTIQHRKLDRSRNSVSARETNSLQRLGSNHFDDKNFGMSCRKSRERTD